MTGQSATDSFIEEKRHELNKLRKDFDALSRETAAVAEHSSAAGRLIESLKSDHHMTETQIQRLFDLDGATVKRYIRMAGTGHRESASSSGQVSAQSAI